MIQKRAQVIAMDDNTVTIQFLEFSKSSCTLNKNCCHYLKDNSNLEKKTTILKLPIKAKLQVGDFISISLKESKRIMLNVLLYGLPLLMALLGYMLSFEIPYVIEYTAKNGDNLIAIAIAFISFVGSFYVLSLTHYHLFRFIEMLLPDGSKIRLDKKNNMFYDCI